MEPRRIAIMLDLQWPYKRHAAVFAGTQKYAEEQGWHSIIDEFAHDSLSASKHGSVAYDGIIARANLRLLKAARGRRVPVVNVWGSSPVRDELPGVFPDYAVVGRQCAEHLLARGFANFATLTPLKNRTQDSVVGEFVRVVKEAGCECSIENVPRDPWRDAAHWRRTVQRLEGCVKSWRPPVGVYIVDEGIGRMAAQACRLIGLRVPTDVAIIAGQNDETLCERPRPSLTSVEFGFDRIGYEAARLLHELMDGGDPPSAPRLLPPQGLVVRESTDFHAVQDELVAAALQFIAANAHRPIGQDDVARAVNAEVRTLQNRFRKHLGRAIAAEIRRLRIERAKRELTQSGKRLSEIARDVGLGTSQRMYEIFRRELDVTPGEYRKQRQLRTDA